MLQNLILFVKSFLYGGSVKGEDSVASFVLDKGITIPPPFGQGLMIGLKDQYIEKNLLQVIV